MRRKNTGHWRREKETWKSYWEGKTVLLGKMAACPLRCNFVADCSDQRCNASKCIHTALCTYRLDFSLSTVWAPGGCLSRASSLTCYAKRAHNTYLFNDSMNEWMNSNLDPTTRFYGTKRLCHELQHCLLGEKWPFVQLFIFSVFSFCIFFSFCPNKIKHGSSHFQPNPFKKYCSLM